MSAAAPLHRMVAWAHRLLAEILRPGDLAVDLTAGNGGDTEFLYRCVGRGGRVLAFDLQEDALAGAAGRLWKAEAQVHLPQGDGADLSAPGIYLIHDDHARIRAHCSESPRAAIANLGFCPGGDRSIVTGVRSTCMALSAALELLAPGGRAAVVVYVGHEGGREEADGVESLFASLPPGLWLTLRMGVPNRAESPFLLLAEKRRL